MCAGSVNDKLLDALRNEDIDFIPKNPYLKKAKNLGGILFSIYEVSKNFAAIFDNNSLPIIIEIGSYMGQTLIELAKANPKVNFIGIDIVFKRVVKTSEKIKKNRLNNVKMVIGDGLKLLEGLPENSVSGICVFFPDPWEKKKKKRLINDVFLERTKLVLNTDGFLWVKTDHKDYYEDYNKKILEKRYIPENNFPDILREIVYPTYFESLFENQNKMIYENLLIPEAKE